MSKKIREKKSTLFSLLFIAAVILLTLWSLSRAEDPDKLIKDIQNASPVFLVLAVLCVLAFICLQGVVIWLQCRSLKLQESLWRCVLVAFHGYFYCSITPMQSGGPPIQIYDLKKEGIHISVGTLIILMETFLFKVVLVILSLGMLLFGHRLMRRYIWPGLFFFILGTILTCGIVVLIYLSMFHSGLLRRLILWLFRKLEKHHLVRSKKGRVEKLISAMDKYRAAAGYFRNQRKLSVLLLAVTMLQRLAYFSTTYFIYRSFGLHGVSYWTIVLLQAAISICADMLPIPGGVGITEALFQVFFRDIFGAMTIPGLCLSRGITFYAQLLFCGIFSFAARVAFRVDKSRLGFFQTSFIVPEDAP